MAVKLIRGDSVSLPVTIPSDAIVDLIGYRAFLTIKPERSVEADDETDSAAVLKTDVVLTDNSHTFYFYLTPEQTDIQPGVYAWDVQLVSPDKSVVRTLVLAPSCVEIVPDITRRSS